MSRTKTVEERDYWKNLWNNAFHNLPWKVFKYRRDEWVVFDKPINIDLFARLDARKNLTVDNGVRYRRVLIKSTGCFRATHLLSFLLGEQRYGGRRIYRGRTEGTALRNPIQRARLIALAKDDSLYWEFLKGTGTDHRYSKEKFETVEEWVLNPKRRTNSETWTRR